MKRYIMLGALVTMPLLSTAAEKDEIAESTFRKAIKAAGGEQRFKTLKAPTMWMLTGTYYAGDQEVPFVTQCASYWPKRWYRRMVEDRFGVGVAGEQVTLFQADGAEGEKLSGARQKAFLHRVRVYQAPLLYPLLEDEYTFSKIPGVEVAGKATVGIKAVHASGSEIMLYFDKNTFLLSKLEAKVEGFRGNEVKSETVYSAHKPFGGVKLPSKYKRYYDGKLVVEGSIIAIKTHATVDPAWFGTEGPKRVR